MRHLGDVRQVKLNQELARCDAGINDIYHRILRVADILDMSIIDESQKQFFEFWVDDLRKNAARINGALDTMKEFIEM